MDGRTYTIHPWVAGTGMGRLTARTLAQVGHTVYASTRDIAERNADKAAEVQSSAGQHTVGLHAVELDQ